MRFQCFPARILSLLNQGKLGSMSMIDQDYIGIPVELLWKRMHPPHVHKLHFDM